MKSFQPFVGREVAVEGLEFVVPSVHNRAVMQRQISIRSADDIKIVDVAGKDPFAVPTLDEGPLSLDSIPSAGSRKAVGRVIARWHKNRVIVKKPDGDTLMAEFRDGIPLPDMGESIEISGTPETELYRIHLLRAVRLHFRRETLEGASRRELPLVSNDAVGLVHRRFHGIGRRDDCRIVGSRAPQSKHKRRRIRLAIKSYSADNGKHG